MAKFKTTSAQTLFFIGFIFLNAIFYSDIVKTGFNFRTDLSSMLPPNIDTEQPSMTEKNLQAINTSKILMVIGAHSLDQLDHSYNLIIEKIEKFPLLKEENSEEFFFTSALPLLKKHKFQLPPPKNHSNADLTALLLGEINNQPQWGAKIIPLEEDFLGTLNRHIESYAKKLPEKEFTANWKGQQFEFKAIVLESTVDSMEIDTQIAIASWIATLKQDIKSKTGSTLLASGIVLYSAHAAQQSKSEIAIISTLSTVSILLLCWLIFKSLSPLLLASTSLFAGLVTSIGFCHWLFSGINLFTLVFGAALIGVAIDFTIHLCFNSSIHNNTSTTSLKHSVTRPILLSLLSTIIGYSTLAFTGLESLREIAWFSICGLIISCCVTLIFGQNFTQKLKKTTVLSVNLPLLSTLKQLRLAIPLILFASIITAYTFELNNNPKSLYPTKPEIIEQTKFINDNISHFESSRYLILTSHSEDELLRTLQTMTTEIDSWVSEGIIEDYLSINSWVPTKKVQNDNFLFFSRLVNNDYNQDIAKIGIKQLMFEHYISPLKLSPPQSLSPSKFSQALGQSGQFLWQSNDNYFSAIIRFKKLSDSSHPIQLAKKYNGAYWVDIPTQLEDSLNALQYKALLYLVLGYLLIFIIMLTCFNKTEAGTIILIPILSSLFTVLILSLAQIPLSLFHVLALYLILGLGIDYSVFMSTQHAQAQKTYSGVIVSAITSALAFGLLMLSTTPFIHQFGTTVMLGCIFNVILAGCIPLQLKRETTRLK